MSTGPVGSTLFENITFSNPNDVEAVLLNYGAVRSGVLDEAIRNANALEDQRNQTINDLNRVNSILQRARPIFDNVNREVGPISDEELDFIRSSLDTVNIDIDAFIGPDTNPAPPNFPPNQLFVLEDGGYQRLLDEVRNAVDSASSNSQLELIALQALINRRNQTIEFTTNLVARFSGLQDRIVGNLRN